MWHMSRYKRSIRPPHTTLRDRPCHPEAHHEMPRERPLPDGGFLFFGDSFVRIFTLIGNPEIGVKAFKGATAKGLTKEKNENRQEIIETLGARPGTQCAIFVFGNVDVHMSYYYCKHGKETPTARIRA